MAKYRLKLEGKKNTFWQEAYYRWEYFKIYLTFAFAALFLNSTVFEQAMVDGNEAMVSRLVEKAIEQAKG